MTEELQARGTGTAVPARLHHRLGRALLEHWRDPLYRNSYYLMANTVTMTGLGFVFWLVVARVFPPADFGLASAIISAMTLLAMLAKLGLDVTMIRHLPAIKSPSDATHFTRTIFTYSGGAAVLLAAGFVIGIPLWSPRIAFVHDQLPFAVAFVVLVLIWNQAQLLDSFFVARRSARWVFAKNAAYSLVKIPLPVVLLSLFGLQAFGIFASWGIAMGLAVVGILLLVGRREHSGFHIAPIFRPRLVEGLRSYAGSNYLAGLAIASIPMLFPLLVVNLLGPEENAVFYVDWQIAGLLMMVPAALASPLLSEGAYRPEVHHASLWRAIKYALMLVIPGAILLLLLDKFLLGFFGGEYREEGVFLLGQLALGSIPYVCTTLYLAGLRVTRELRELVLLSLGITAGAIGFGTMGLIRYGLAGFGWGWIGVQTAACVYALFRLARRHHNEMRARRDVAVDDAF